MCLNVAPSSATWTRVSIWLAVGALVYAFYGRRNSSLRDAVYVPAAHVDEIYESHSNIFKWGNIGVEDLFGRWNPNWKQIFLFTVLGEAYLGSQICLGEDIIAVVFHISETHLDQVIILIKFILCVTYIYYYFIIGKRKCISIMSVVYICISFELLVLIFVNIVKLLLNHWSVKVGLY